MAAPRIEVVGMRKFFLLIGLLLASCQLAAEQVRLDILIGNIEDAVGTMLVTIYDKPDHWLKQPYFRSIKQDISSTDDVTIVVADMPAGSYAISVFHDLNNNLELDTNFIGIPKEPYGFSGTMGKFGPPKFDGAAVPLAPGENTISIELK
jgi:uncharacterized protein (DUF2141 family)